MMFPRFSLLSFFFMSIKPGEDQPRQGPDGRTFENKDTPKRTSIAVSFLTHTAQLEAPLPPGFALAGEPGGTVYATYEESERT